MIKLTDVLTAIDEVDQMPDSYAKAEKLATFITLRNALTPEAGYKAAPPDTTIYKGDSEFARLIRDKDPQEAWAVMDELMETLQIINPRLYDGVLNMLR